MEFELIAIGAVIVVVAVSVLAPRVGVAAPLVLVVLGLCTAFLRIGDSITVPPELILGGILPPLLYSAAVNTPSMEFRRDFRLISLFSVVLVGVSAVTIGLLACALVPGLPLGIGIALGAIISPTDAVATAVIRQAGVSQRIVTVIEGESMLNDATALVLLRSAVAAIGVTVTVWQVALDFLWAVAAAALIGFIVGRLNLEVRARVTPVTSSVTISLIVPFLAYIPAEELGASGLVAVVTAGLVTGYGSPRKLGAEERIAERSLWRTIELLLESTVFLLVGLEAPALAEDLVEQGGGLGLALMVAVGSITVALLLRSGFVALSVWWLARRNRRTPTVRQHLTDIQEKLADGVVPELGNPERTRRRERRVRAMAIRAGATRGSEEARIGSWQRMVNQRLADLDYLAAEAFGWREGVVLVWAGMRGAVTVAAAQTLPSETPNRSLLILAAALVAVGTLLVQGGTIGWLVRRLRLTGHAPEADPVQWSALQRELNEAALDRLSAELDGYPQDLVERARDRLRRASSDDFRPDSPVNREVMAKYRKLRLKLIAAQRDELMAIRDLGTYPSGMLDAALAQLDADQIGIELRGA